jgi:hypothetical protein
VGVMVGSAKHLHDGVWGKFEKEDLVCVYTRRWTEEEYRTA